MNRLVLAACAALAISAAPTRAHAQPAPDPRVLFEQGHADFRAGNFRPALRTFQRVFELTGNHAVLFNIAVTWQRLGEPGEAARTLRRYLVAEPAAPNRADIERQIETLEREERALHPQQPQASAPVAATPVVANAAPHVAPDEPARSIAAPAAVTAIGVAGLAAGVVFVVLRGSALERLRTQCDTTNEPWHCDDSMPAHADYDAVGTWGLAGGIALGVGAVAAIGGGLWLLFGGPPAHTATHRARIDAVPLPGGGLFTVGGSF